MAALMDLCTFVICAIFLPCMSEKHSVLLLTFPLSGFKNFEATRTSKTFCNIKVNIVVVT